ncbi:hypothetical protein AKO1_013939 [Acrasis kona]|uniref:AttH domain-containing protein n=1 Tax=Acrasis kona TaxID=1008807 RepID=A0AAW2Z4T3_9EUKA
MVWFRLFYVIILVLTALVLSQDNAYFPLPGNGVLQPPMHYQRYRRGEYNKEPYYQWWYYWIRDTKTNRNFALAYSTTQCKGSKYCDFDATILMFALVDNSNNRRFQKYETYSHDSFSVKQDFNVEIRSNNTQEPLFELIPQTNDVIKLKGHMKKENVDNVWICQNCEKSLEIEWDLTIRRIHGYYAQDIFELPDKYLEGIIMWNTYTHTSQVEGTIKIGGEEFVIENKPHFRAYGDMNWGQIMPDAPPGKSGREYAWGWYYFNIPSDEVKSELSIIAGTGVSYADKILRTMEGKFSDVRLGNSTGIQFRRMSLWSQNFDSCSDGKIHKFEVERSQWMNLTDAFGVASIPMRQIVTLESSHYQIKLDFQSIESNYNRLLFPFKNFIFSDFEALGVKTTLTVFDVKSQVLLMNVTHNGGGLEYGYRYKVTVPPLPKL